MQGLASDASSDRESIQSRRAPKQKGVQRNVAGSDDALRNHRVGDLAEAGHVRTEHVVAFAAVFLGGGGSVLAFRPPNKARGGLKVALFFGGAWVPGRDMLA